MSRADGKARRQAARDKYKPDSVRCLVIAEAPPSEDRYFYFEDVPQKDYLFLAVMGVVFRSEYQGYDRSPAWKARLLRAFQADGFWLLDAVDEPLVGAPSGTKRRAEYILTRSDLMPRMETLHGKGDVSQHTPIILVKANVYVAFFNPLVEGGYNVVDQRIPFPSSGRQGEFAVAFSRALGVLP